MKHLLGLIVSLVVSLVFLTSALAFLQAQTSVSATFVPFAQAKQKADQPKKEESKADSTKKAEPKKAEVKKGEVRKQAVAAKRLIVRGRAAVVPGEPNPQVLQQYRPMLWAEYHLARNVCDLSLDQRKAIARDAEHAFQEAIAKSGMNPQMGFRVAGGGANQRHEPDDSIREGLSKAVKDHLKPEQLARYQAELDKRAANRKRVTVDVITAKIDESLILTVEQRDKIRESLVTNWKESWCPSPESFLFNAQMVPQIPDQFIVPILNDTQKSIWRGLNKFAGANFRVFGFMGNNMANGDTPEDDPLREAREAETKAREEARTKREAQQKNEAETKKADDDAKAKAKLRELMQSKKTKVAK